MSCIPAHSIMKKLLICLLFFSAQASALEINICGDASTNIAGTSVPNMPGYVYDAGGCPSKSGDTASVQGGKMGDVVKQVLLPAQRTVLADTLKHLPSAISGGYVPAGWTENASHQLIPPSTVTPASLGYQYSVNPVRSTPLAACKDGNPTVVAALPTQIATHPYSYGCSFDGVTTPFFVGEQLGCPAGYVGTTTCTLDNAALVQKPADGHCNVVRSGNSFFDDPNDPDCTSSPTVTAGSATSQTPAGKTTITGNGDGTTTVINKTYNNTTNTTTTNTTIYNHSTGVVTGSSTTTNTGTGIAETSNPATPTPTDVSALATHADVNAVGSKLDTANGKLDAIKAGQCGGSGQPPCKLDEAGTSSTFTGSQSAGLDAQADSLTSQIKNQQNGAGPGLPIDPITNAIPVTSQCVNPGFNASDIHAGANFTLPLCEHASQVQPYLRWVVWIFTAMGIWGIWFQKLGGA
jgi:hypothetical protein